MSKAKLADKTSSTDKMLTLQQQCFENLHSSMKPPCDCCTFPEENHKVVIPDWGNFFVPKYHVHLTYASTLLGVANDADWLKLPDRETLIREYDSDCPSLDKKSLEACLNTLRFDPATGLGKVHDWIRRYIYHQHKHGWYYVSICVRDMLKFVLVMKNLDLVVLPYGCVSDGEVGFETIEPIRWQSHNRKMIVVVKDNDRCFLDAMIDIGFTKRCYPHENVLKKINYILAFVKTIAYVSQPRERELHYVIFEPMLRHAVWWMLLLFPHGMLKKTARKAIYEDDEGTTERIKNCVVLFDPWNQRIDVPIYDLRERIHKNRPFAYGFGNDVLSVTDVHTHVISCRQYFVRWCVSKQMNTLLNLKTRSLQARKKNEDASKPENNMKTI